MMAVGPKYLKYGILLRVLRVKPAFPGQYQRLSYPIQNNRPSKHTGVFIWATQATDGREVRVV